MYKKVPSTNLASPSFTSASSSGAGGGGGGIVQESVDPFGDWDAAPKRISNKLEPVLTEEAQNARLWSDANADADKIKKVPMYSIVTHASNSSTSASTSSAIPSRVPPSAALFPQQGPSLTILKRPSSASSNNSSSSKSAPSKQKTIAEREREYEEARRRIYGDSPSSTTSAAPPTPNSKFNNTGPNTSLSESGGRVHNGSSTSVRSTGSNSISTKGKEVVEHGSTITPQSSTTRRSKTRKEVYDPMITGISALSMSNPPSDHLLSRNSPESRMGQKVLRAPIGPAEDGSGGFNRTQRTTPRP